MDRRYAKIFKPGAYPDLTYVTRMSGETKYTYEDRLKQSLSIDGYLTYIVGPSKTGKTVLCENVIGKEKMVPMSGNDFAKENDFWTAVGKKVGLSMNAEVSRRNADFSESEERSTEVRKNYLGNKDIVIDHFTESGKVLVLDDFHYASDKIQYDIACQLKEVIRLGFKAIVISLPYRSDDAIRLNPDLTGRISIIEIEPWKQRELEEIARKGFCELGIELEARLIERMALESINSPQLMQSICLNIGLLPFDVEKITDEVIMESCRFTCNNFPYSDVVRVLKSGPPTRGQKRLTYELQDGSRRDIYSIILKAIADNPPRVEISFEHISKRVQKNVKNQKITAKKIRDTLKNLQKIMDEQIPLYQVFEWKDDMIHILDSLFLFYIRWMPF